MDRNILGDLQNLSLYTIQVRTVRVEKRINDIVNRLNRTKVERKPDLKGKLEVIVWIKYEVALASNQYFLQDDLIVSIELKCCGLHL